MKLAAVILSAGASRRNGGQPKALLVHDGEPQILRLARHLSQVGFSPIWAITGAHHVQIADVVRVDAPLRVVENPHWRAGMSSSLRLGLELAAQRPELGGLLITPVDLLGATPADWQALQTAFLAHPEIVATATEPENQPGTPIIVAPAYFASLRERLEGDSGARDWLREQGRPVHLCALPNLTRDTDSAPQPQADS